MCPTDLDGYIFSRKIFLLKTANSTEYAFHFFVSLLFIFVMEVTCDNFIQEFDDDNDDGCTPQLTSWLRLDWKRVRDVDLLT